MHVRVTEVKIQSDLKAEADHLASQHYGECLSACVPSTKALLLWKCVDPSHPAWPATFTDVKGRPSRKGGWCRLCHFGKQRRHSLEQVRQFFEQRRIALVSDTYQDTKTPVVCRCKTCAHEWRTTFNAIQQGHLCPHCAIRRRGKNARIKKEEALKIFAERKIRLVDGYRDSKKLKHCRCEQCGNVWRTNLNRVQSGAGCPKCAVLRRSEKRRFTSDDVVRLLREKRITVLTQYVNSSTPLACRCDVCLHEWTPRLANLIHQNQGCPKCAGRVPKARADYEKIAMAHEGEILVMGLKAEDASTWLCKDGHQFSRSYENIRATDTFCTTCSGRLPKQLSDYEALAAKFGGKVERMAQSVTHAAFWKCGRGHEFKRAYAKIAECDRFCPVCSSRLGERLCRTIAEQLFGVPFPKVKLRGIRGPRGGYLELDAFNENLLLAIEHHGGQHFHAISIWGGEPQFQRQKEHDRLRREYCRQNGITLIEVRELGSVTSIEDLKTAIKEKCIRHGVPLPRNYDCAELHLAAVSLKPEEEKLFDRLKAEASQKSWILLDQTYLGSQTPHHFQCEEGHKFSLRPYQAKNIKGCPGCWNLKRVRRVKLSDGRVFQSLIDAGHALGVTSSAVGYAARNQTMCKGFQVSLVDAPNHTSQ